MKKRALKKIAVLAAAIPLLASELFSMNISTVNAQNPICQNLYTADPAPMVYKDTLYVFTSHDNDGAEYYDMTDWHLFKTTDMQNWTDCGSPLGYKTFSWSTGDAWAGQCIERNGKFYYYVPLKIGQYGTAIGVGVSDNPEGPYRDALGKPLIEGGYGNIDPTVFIDNDGQAYLYWGNPDLKYVKLNSDMISYSGSVQTVNLTIQGFGQGSGDRKTRYQEGPWFYRRGNIYYMVYAASGIPEDICYSTSTSPTGPWTFRGQIMASEGRSFTNHPGLIDYKGHSYFFYHNGALPGGNGFQRSVAVEEFTYGTDGSIPRMKMSDNGPAQLQTLNPYQKVEAETICWGQGIEIEPCGEGTQNVAYIDNGDYIMVKGVNFGNGAGAFEARVASPYSGNIEIRLDSVNGKLAGTCAVPKTGDWQKYVTSKCNVSGANGTHDVYFKFTGGSGSLFNFNWWQFTPADGTVVENPTQTPSEQPSQSQPAVSGKIADGWYYIKGVGSQKYLSVESYSAKAGANVCINSGSGVDGQQWKVTNLSDGYMTLTSKLGNFMLDVANGSSADDANIGIYTGYSGDAQRFVAKETSTQGVYTINTKSSDGSKVLDVAARSTQNGANVCQYRSNGQTNQQWIFEPVNGTAVTPTQQPTVVPTVAPTVQPTVVPTQAPTVAPTVQPTVQPTVVPTQAPQQQTGDISCSYKTTGDWGSGFQGEITIKNNTLGSINGWTVTFTTNAKINSLWGANLVGQSGSTVTVKNNDWDTSFAPNGTISIGFVADGNASNCTPSNFKLNGSLINGGVSELPTKEPTKEPTVAPTQVPTKEPTVAPTQVPTKEPTVTPTQVPTQAPTEQPSQSADKIADGWYYIKGVGSQKYLSVANNNGTAGANVCINSGSSVDGQQWKVTNLSDGYMTLTSKLGNFMLDVANGSSEDGTNIGIYTGYSGDAQRFVAKETGTAGIYTINTKSSSGTKVLDVEARSTQNGANVCQYRSNGQTNQQWIFEPVSGSSQQQPTQTPVEQPTQVPDTGKSVYTSFPTLNMDVPDLDIICVNNTFYMVSTTMNMCPGVPIMKSTDLVHWQIVNYVYDTFENDDYTNLNNGKDMYARGSWAASLKYDEVSKLYYVAFNSNNHGFFVYTTNDIENGKWTKHSMRGSFHDPALYFENGNMYVISASGGTCKLQQLSLSGSNVVTVGSARTLFSASGWSLWEGAHAYKINGTYYVFIIGSPNGRWMRTQICYKSNSLTSGSWQEKIIYQNGVGSNGAGLAQGGVIQAPNGNWFGFAFQDNGAIGRSPSVVPIKWENGWPMFQGNRSAGMTLEINDSGKENYIVDDDDFNGSTLKKVWQWNHNPQNNYWSLTNGNLRLKTDRTVTNIWSAHNSLTQRTYGNTCQSEVKITTDGMKPGDYAGISAVADNCGMVGVMCNDQGERYVFQANADFKKGFSNPATSYQKIAAGQAVYLKIAYSFSGNSSASFYYSFDGKNWTKIGNNRSLGFSTSTTFMGTRTWLFNYATKQAGGYVDFDYYKIYN